MKSNLIVILGLALTGCGEASHNGWHVFDQTYENESTWHYVSTHEKLDPEMIPDESFYYGCSVEHLAKSVMINLGERTGGDKPTTFSFQFDDSVEILEYAVSETASRFNLDEFRGKLFTLNDDGDKIGEEIWAKITDSETVSIYWDGNRKTSEFDLKGFKSAMKKLPEKCRINTNWKLGDIKQAELNSEIEQINKLKSAVREHFTPEKITSFQNGIKGLMGKCLEIKREGEDWERLALNRGPDVLNYIVITDPEKKRNILNYCYNTGEKYRSEIDLTLAE